MSRVPSAILRNKGVPVDVADVDGDKRVLGEDESAHVVQAHVRFDANAMADLEEAYGSLDGFDDAVQKTPTTCIRRALSIVWHVSPKTAGLMMLDGRQEDYATAIAVALAMANGVDPQSASDMLAAGMGAASEARRERSKAAMAIAVEAARQTEESLGTNGGPNGSATAILPTPVPSGV